VEFAGLTIEHVLPQTLTADWRRALSRDPPCRFRRGWFWLI
jgi:hypothetical protein